MGLTVSLLLNVEKLRDGGSYMVEFQCNNGSRYYLLIPVQLAGHEVAGYGEPLLVNQSNTLELRLSQVDAQAILKQLLSIAELEKEQLLIRTMSKIL